jgi:hypothetical protein
MTSNGYSSLPPQGLLAERFPVNSLQKLTLQTGEAVSGRVYCTDEITGSIVLQKALVHTTLASEIRIVAAASVTKSVALEEGDDAAITATPLTQPLPKVQKKALEERERRAIRLAEESLRHINQMVRSLLARVESGSVGMNCSVIRCLLAKIFCLLLWLSRVNSVFAPRNDVSLTRSHFSVSVDRFLLRKLSRHHRLDKQSLIVYSRRARMLFGRAIQLRL